MSCAIERNAVDGFSDLPPNWLLIVLALSSGKKANEIASELGCRASYVWNVKYLAGKVLGIKFPRRQTARAEDNAFLRSYRTITDTKGLNTQCVVRRRPGSFQTAVRESVHDLVEGAPLRDELSLDPPIEKAAAVFRRAWTPRERMMRALWAFPGAYEFRGVKLAEVVLVRKGGAA